MIALDTETMVWVTRFILIAGLAAAAFFGFAALDGGGREAAIRVLVAPVAAAMLAVLTMGLAIDANWVVFDSLSEAAPAVLPFI